MESRYATLGSFSYCKGFKGPLCVPVRGAPRTVLGGGGGSGGRERETTLEPVVGAVRSSRKETF